VGEFEACINTHRHGQQGAVVFWRRVAHLFFIVAVVTVLGGTYPAAASTASAQASKGSVDLTISTGCCWSDYTVHFRGPISDHGWSYSGTLTGVGTTSVWTATMDETPILSMTSDDGTVSGNCAGNTVGTDEVAQAADIANVTEAPAVTEIGGEVSTAAIEMDFGCVLSRNGGTPWQISLHSTITQDTSAGATWTGSYAETDVATPQVNVKGALTYGDVQLGWFSPSGALQYGPLRFSGQIAIGATLYRGDLVSDLNNPVTALPGGYVPPLAVSGSSNGVNVSGTCNAVYNAAALYDLVCTLAVDSAAPVTVSLQPTYVTSIRGQSYRDGWGDDAGYFVSG